MGEINRRKVNISIAITPRLLKLTENAVKEGEYSSVSDAVQTILSEFIGKEEFLREMHGREQTDVPEKSRYERNDPERIGLEKNDTLSEKRHTRMPPAAGKTRITISLNTRTAAIIRQTAEEAGDNVSNFISGILERYFKRPAENDRIAEEKAPYDTAPDIIRIPEKEADRFALSYVEKMFREQNPSERRK